MAGTTTKILLFSLILLPQCIFATLVPPHLEDAVVALGSMQPFESPGQPCTLRWTTEGTGFLYGYLIKNDPNPAKRSYMIYLVTNRHVIEDHVKGQRLLRMNLQSSHLTGECSQAKPDETIITVRINPVSALTGGQQFPLPINNWFFHPNNTIDIAGTVLNAPFLQSQGLLDAFFSSDQIVANKEKLKSMGVSAGDGVFVLGFPMNLAGVQRNYVIVRQGCIARISSMLGGADPTFLLDAFTFPGNSGSPVILKPEAISITGTPAQNNAYLIGIVRSYIPYTDLAISPQTGRPRISFEENSGLAEVLPVDNIDEAIRFWQQANPQAR
jgi:hypothetical protein